MSAIEKMSAEQLWYTWSDVGLSTVHAGFRIRAASEGLTEIYGERVQSMDRHMRYVLPSNADPFAITPDMAPICLAFIRTGWNNEYILVHKNYLGKDGVGRQGNFFVHAIALGELSQYISPADAIKLWDSHIWAANDGQLDRRSNALETIPMKRLQSEIENFQPDYASVRQYLPFLIEAYLTRKERYPLYIAAPAHTPALIAYLIGGLVDNLPRQLVAGLTFSTYEPDVAKATTEIVGTSWIATPGKDAEAARVFSPQFYQENLAINCYTGDHSPLQSHPQIAYNPLAADFAAYVTDCLFSGDVEQLYDLLELAEKKQSLDINLFLRMYSNEIVNVEGIIETDIEKDLADPNVCIDRLCNRNFRKRIIERAGENRQWTESQLKRLLLALLERAEREYVALSPGRIQNKSVESSGLQAQGIISFPQAQKKRNRNAATTQTKKNQVTLAEALALLAERAIPDLIDAMKKVGARREVVPGQNDGESISRQKQIDTIVALLYVIDWCVLPQDPTEIWKQLFDQIMTNRNAAAFLNTQWGIFLWLLPQWDNALLRYPGHDNALRPLLTVPWSSLGEFLQLGLHEEHKHWNIFAVESLIRDTSLTFQAAQELAQTYSKPINDLLAQLSQEPDPSNATYFAIRLIEQGYLAQSQFALPMERLLMQLLRDPRDPQLLFYAKEVVVTLTRNNYPGTDSYLTLVETLLSSLLSNKQANLQANGNELVNILVEHRYPRKKNLVDLLFASSGTQANLESILQRIYPTAEELNAFFLNDGSGYLSTPNHFSAMVSLYQGLLQQLPRTQKLERLFVLLDAPLDENIILYLLNITPLERDEPARILERYGKSYLRAFQQRRQLANKVVEWFIQLVNARYADISGLFFAVFTSQTDYQLLETLLSSAHLSLEESRQFFKKYGFEQQRFPFFYWSKTSLALFSRLAQAANTRAGSGQSELAVEKMNLLLAWLQPSQQLPKPDTVESILRAVSLTPPEQSGFLERYGELYLSHYPQLPVLGEYINTYVMAFNTESLDRKGATFFLQFLAQRNQLQSLEPGTQNRILCWKTIDSYFTSPSTQPDMLAKLAQALFHLVLPNNSEFITKLARAFVSCARNSDDLSAIKMQMQEVPKLTNNISQLLYVVAEQIADGYPQQQNAFLLLPYLSFALNITLPTTETGLRYFIQEFLDILLCNIKVLDLNAWKTLDTLLAQQQLSTQAQKRWQEYLNGLHLLDRLNSAEVMENGPIEPETQSQTQSATDAPPRPPSWSTQLLQWVHHPIAKMKLNNALRSKKADRIAETWEQFGTAIDILPGKPIRRDQVEISHRLIYLCRVVTAHPNDSIENDQKIIELYSRIRALKLFVSDDTFTCIVQANKRIEAGQASRNSGRFPADSLPAGQIPTSLTGRQREPKPHIIGNPSASGSIPGQSQQSGAKFGIDEGPKGKKNKKK